MHVYEIFSAAERLARVLEADGEPSHGLVAALDHAACGFAVFPVAQNGKLPAIEFWRELATTGQDQIMRWWARHPKANVGIATAGLLIVDVDPARGGEQSLAALAEAHGPLPDTIAVVSQGGGSHLYFALQGAVAFGGTDVLGRGVDVRAIDGYVVAPGSTIDGRPYSWCTGCAPWERNLATAPEWLAEACSARRQNTIRVGRGTTVTDDETALNLALLYLDHFAPEAVRDERQQAARLVGRRLLSFGLSTETCSTLLVGLWNRFDCYPSLSADEIDAALRQRLPNQQTNFGSL